MRALLAALGLAFATNAAASPAQTAPAITHADGVAAHAGVDAIYADFARGYAELDAVAVADLYTEDAWYLSAGDAADRGREVIHDSFRGMFGRNAARGHRLEIRFHVDHRVADTAVVSDVGVFDLSYFDGEDQRVAHSRGRFVVVARPESDRWRFDVDVYHPMPAEEEAP